MHARAQEGAALGERTQLPDSNTHSSDALSHLRALMSANSSIVLTPPRDKSPRATSCTFRAVPACTRMTRTCLRDGRQEQERRPHPATTPCGPVKNLFTPTSVQSGFLRTMTGRARRSRGVIWFGESITKEGDRIIAWYKSEWELGLSWVFTAGISRR